MPAEISGPRLSAVDVTAVDVTVAVVVATETLMSGGRSKVMPMDLHMFCVKPRVTFRGVLELQYAKGVGFLRQGNGGRVEHTLLIRDAAGTGDVGLQGAHKRRRAEAVDVGVGAAGGCDGRFGDVLLEGFVSYMER